MHIFSSSRRVTRDGSIKGTIMVKDGRRRYSVKYSREPGGHACQWGAPTDILIFTYPEFEKLIERE